MLCLYRYYLLPKQYAYFAIFKKINCHLMWLSAAARKQVSLGEYFLNEWISVVWKKR